MMVKNNLLDADRVEANDRVEADEDADHESTSTTGTMEMNSNRKTDKRCCLLVLVLLICVLLGFGIWGVVELCKKSDPQSPQVPGDTTPGTDPSINVDIGSLSQFSPRLQLVLTHALLNEAVQRYAAEKVYGDLTDDVPVDFSYFNYLDPNTMDDNSFAAAKAKMVVAQSPILPVHTSMENVVGTIGNWHFQLAAKLENDGPSALLNEVFVWPSARFGSLPENMIMVTFRDIIVQGHAYSRDGESFERACTKAEKANPKFPVCEDVDTVIQNLDVDTLALVMQSWQVNLLRTVVRNEFFAEINGVFTEASFPLQDLDVFGRAISTLFETVEGKWDALSQAKAPISTFKGQPASFETWTDIRPHLDLSMKGGNVVKIRQMQMTQFLRDQLTELEKSRQTSTPAGSAPDQPSQELEDDIAKLRDAIAAYSFQSFSDQDFGVHLKRTAPSDLIAVEDALMTTVVIPSLRDSLADMVREKNREVQNEFLREIQGRARTWANQKSGDVIEKLKNAIQELLKAFQNAKLNLLRSTKNADGSRKDLEKVARFLAPAELFLSELQRIKTFELREAKASFDLDAVEQARNGQKVLDQQKQEASVGEGGGRTATTAVEAEGHPAEPIYIQFHRGGFFQLKSMSHLTHLDFTEYNRSELAHFNLTRLMMPTVVQFEDDVFSIGDTTPVQDNGVLPTRTTTARSFFAAAAPGADNPCNYCRAGVFCVKKCVTGDILRSAISARLGSKGLEVFDISMSLNGEKLLFELGTEPLQLALVPPSKSVSVQSPPVGSTQNLEIQSAEAQIVDGLLNTVGNPGWVDRHTYDIWNGLKAKKRFQRYVLSLGFVCLLGRLDFCRRDPAQATAFFAFVQATMERLGSSSSEEGSYSLKALVLAHVEKVVDDENLQAISISYVKDMQKDVAQSVGFHPPMGESQAAEAFKDDVTRNAFYFNNYWNVTDFLVPLVFSVLKACQAKKGATKATTAKFLEEEVVQHLSDFFSSSVKRLEQMQAVAAVLARRKLFVGEQGSLSAQQAEQKYIQGLDLKKVQEEL